MTSLATIDVRTKWTVQLLEMIATRRARVGVIGLGYVGLPLSLEFARAGFSVTGLDVDDRKLRAIHAGQSYVKDVSDSSLAEAVGSGRFQATADYGAVAHLDAVSICVPTPLRKTRDPDISYIVEAVSRLKPHLHPGMLLILESTTYPGTTNEILLPAVSDFVVGEELFVAFSPERVDPGNRTYNTRNTPKIIGGVTPRCTEVACALYAQAIDRVIPVSSTTCAEMVKLLENTFRSVNIGLVNELAIMCDKLNVPVWEVIDAAATKPFGFMPFYPGPGLGGHCIPIDPLYLSWKLKMLNYTARFIELAAEVNGHMPDYVIEKLRRVMNQRRLCLNDSAVVIVGVSYKRDIDDIRESPALDIIRLLKSEGARVSFVDPYVASLTVDGECLQASPPVPDTYRQADIAVIVTDHSSVDYDLIFRNATLILDTRNAIKQVGSHVFRL